MSVHAWIPSGLTSFGATPLVTVCDTPWGYTIRCETSLSDRAALIERVSGIAGMTFLTLATGQWFFPPVSAGTVAFSPEVMPSVALGIAGMLFMWIAARGLRQEVQVDLEAHQLIWAVCNRNGRSRVLASVDFDAVGSAFIRRSKSPGTSATLCVRLDCCETPVEIARGREAVLAPLHQRLSSDLTVRRVVSAGAHPVRPTRPVRRQSPRMAQAV